MKDGQINRQDIFSKMVERKWPKWKQVQSKIKNFVKNSNLVVKLKDISQEKKNQFEGMMIHIKNVLFAHKGKAATTSMTASQLSHEKPELKLSPFKNFESEGSGVIKFEHLPVGNYAIVFEGNRTYKACEMVIVL